MAVFAEPAGQRFARAARPRATVSTANELPAASPRTGLPDVERRPREPRHTRPSDPRPSVGLFIFGVLFPVAVVVVELLTRMCTTTFFDPLPTPWHVALALALPAGNLVGWIVLVRGETPRLLWPVGLANGVAAGVGFYYALLFLPMLPPALVAILLLGFGLLPLAPLFGFIASVRCRLRLGRLASLDRRTVPGLWPGAALALACVAWVEGPAFITDSAFAMATSAEPRTQNDGVRLLRRWGDRQALLARCYSQRTAESPWRMFDNRPRWQDAVVAQKIFYRVTGQPFEDFPSPVSARGGFLDGRDWADGDQELRGGETVGTLLPGLSLASSRIEGNLNPDAVTAYFEWTFVFSNSQSFPQEARTRIALPAGGVVSRLTLWINAEEREAAFGGRAQVRAAYEQVVKVQRRDPVLVTTAGPDRVQMQCFPVPAGGTMKVRVGVTAPLQLTAVADRGSVQLPCLLDRNFAVAEGAAHWVRVASAGELATRSRALAAYAGAPEAPPRQLSGGVTQADLSARLALSVKRNASVTAVWFDDAFDAPGGTVVQELQRCTEPAPSRVVLAIDASAGMDAAVAAASHALARAPDRGRTSVVVATEEGVADVDVAAVANVHCVGGQDGVALLARAWDHAAKEPGGVILWVHGPQPVALQPADDLIELIKATPIARRPRFVELQARHGRNVVLDVLADAARVEPIPPTDDVRSDLSAALANWSSPVTKTRLVRRKAGARPAEPMPRGDVQLVRLWALDEVLRMCDVVPSLGSSSADSRKAATALAVSHQIVTPVSGAVVLETQQQYDAAGLSPVTAVPLPPGAWMALLTVPVLWLAYRHSSACSGPRRHRRQS